MHESDSIICWAKVFTCCHRTRAFCRACVSIDGGVACRFGSGRSSAALCTPSGGCELLKLLAVFTSARPSIEPGAARRLPELEARVWLEGSSRLSCVWRKLSDVALCLAPHDVGRAGAGASPPVLAVCAPCAMLRPSTTGRRPSSSAIGSRTKSALRVQDYQSLQDKQRKQSHHLLGFPLSCSNPEEVLA